MPRRKKRTRNWCKPCGSATADGCSASSWCGMISGWPSAAFCEIWKFDLSKARTVALVDLFHFDHARKVLAAFGRAFGVLPEKPSETSKEQKEFLEQAVSGLAQEGKVICVRLALFAEMMKGKPWTPATLEGSRRHGRRRRHLPRRDVQCGHGSAGTSLSPESGQGRSESPVARIRHATSRATCGRMPSCWKHRVTRSRPKDFDDLIRILDSEIRLITPTDPEGKDADADSVLQTKPGQKYYQLTHDYLVHSLRDWLTRKQKETRRGRAELLLADRAAVWNARPENRQLPSLLQWFHIRG